MIIDRHLSYNREVLHQTIMDNSKPHILIIGGSGLLGKPVVSEFLRSGYHVRVLTRNPQRARSTVPASVELIEGSVENRADLNAALQGCPYVYISLNQPGDPDLERRGVEAVISAASHFPVERIGYLSGASTCETNAWFPGTCAKWQAEQALYSSGMPYTIFKPSFFMETLTRFVRSKRAVIFSSRSLDRRSFHWLAGNDYAKMVGQGFESELACNRSYTILGPQALTLTQAVMIYATIACPNARTLVLPLWLAGWIAAFGKRPELASALPFFHYLENVDEAGTASSAGLEETRRALGLPQTTIEEWAAGNG